MIADDCWTMVSELVYDWCFIITVFLHYLYLTDLTTSTVPAAHEPVTTFTLTTFNRRPSQPRRQSLVIPPRNHVSVIRQLSRAGHRLASSFRRPGRARNATCSFYVLAAHKPSTSAVLLRGAPRHVSPSTWATSSPNSLAAARASDSQIAVSRVALRAVDSRWVSWVLVAKRWTLLVTVLRGSRNVHEDPIRVSVQDDPVRVLRSRRPSRDDPVFIFNRP